MGIFNLFKTKKAEKIPPEKIQNHNITGVSHYQDNILKLAKNNPLYDLSKKDIIAKKIDGCIYQYKFNPQKTELLPEPNNPHDPNAIKVMIDGQHVGYIKAGSCTRILKLIKEDRIARIESKIGGGNYKMYWNDGISVNAEKGKNNFNVRISIIEK